MFLELGLGITIVVFLAFLFSVFTFFGVVKVILLLFKAGPKCNGWFFNSALFLTCAIVAYCFFDWFFQA